MTINVDEIIDKLSQKRQHKIKRRAKQLLIKEYEYTCEYPMMGGSCGATAKFRGKRTGSPYCHDHGSLIKRWSIEELIPI